MLRLLLLSLFLLTGVSSCKYIDRQLHTQESIVPPAAYETWDYIKKYNKPRKGYVGGKRFGNYEQLLPKTAPNNVKLSYKEWDIHPKKKGQNRGAERLVTSSDGKAYYTADHYASFVKLEP
ncbi:ribonuclease domain-containing protein [uncultured Arcticibacterium sp.]|uniref:ribonuclease domain-containing protein n=1 Tax=uncultured Arcticibacterium sp. TaxID=2173042 RepID=UPI0030F86BE7